MRRNPTKFRSVEVSANPGILKITYRDKINRRYHDITTRRLALSRFDAVLTNV